MDISEGAIGQKFIIVEVFDDDVELSEGVDLRIALLKRLDVEDGLL